jgi:hypothetical protein
MKFDPENQLTEEELDKLGEHDFDGFLEYLDGKSEYLKKFTKPLDTHHLKAFASLDAAEQGKSLTDDDLKKLNKIGKQNEEIAFDKEVHQDWVEKKTDMLKNIGVKNVKTNRKQWFD